MRGRGRRAGPGLLGFGNNTVVEGNILVNNGMITINNGNDREAVIRGNTLCKGGIEGGACAGRRQSFHL